MKHVRRIAIALAFLSSACADPVGPPPEITALPRELTPEEQRLIQADNAFAVKLLKEVSVQTADTLPNLFVSPLSVAMALGMTSNGAAGTTWEAMRTTLELDDLSEAEVNASYQSLIALLRGLDSRVRFQVANSIWYKEGYAIEPAFLDANRVYYDARVSALDFGSPAAPSIINDWVKQQTNGVIDKIVEQIPDGMRLYLINAIYFKGDWTQQFDAGRTAPRPFRLDDGSVIDVPTMTYSEPARVARVGWAPGATILDLPYGGQAFSMTVVLPHDSVRIDDLVAGLTLEQWNGWVANLGAAVSAVYLPKFKLENDLQLIPTLGNLGMGIAFTPSADFTRIHTPSELQITEVKHKTYVDVNEEGTEAAAVTSVGMGVTSVPPSVAVDRPFLFALRENLSGTILFLGVIRHP